MGYFIQILPHIITVLAIALFFGLFSFLCLYLIIKPTPTLTALTEAAFLIFAVGIVGSSIGIIGGLSRAPIAGTVLPAILTSIGGFAVYLFGGERAASRITPAAIVVFVFSSFIAFLQSSAIRSAYDELDFCRTLYAEAARSAAADALQNTDHIFGEYCSKVVSQFKRSQ
jgi:hypothetical protein